MIVFIFHLFIDILQEVQLSLKRLPYCVYLSLIDILQETNEYDTDMLCLSFIYRYITGFTAGKKKEVALCLSFIYRFITDNSVCTRHWRTLCLFFICRCITGIWSMVFRLKRLCLLFIYSYITGFAYFLPVRVDCVYFSF